MDDDCDGIKNSNQSLPASPEIGLEICVSHKEKGEGAASSTSRASGSVDGSVDMFDQESQLSDLSSTDRVQVDDRLHHVMQIERALEIVRLSTQQRRSQRRQWNPSADQTQPSLNPSYCHFDIVSQFPPYPTPSPATNQPVLPGITTPSVLPVLPVVVVDGTIENETSRNHQGLETEENVDSLAKGHSAHTNIDAGQVTPGSSLENSSTDLNSDATFRMSNNMHTHEAAHDSKHGSYDCLVDRYQEDKSVEIPIYSFKRPHMRSFHISWMAFFIAFFTWFSITPLMSEVQKSLDLTHKEIWTSSTIAVSGSAVTRLLIGPICDKYGARWSMAGTLFLTSIPTALTGLVQSATDLYVLRLFVGIAGCAFVTCQYWTSSMFTLEVAGTANALVAGWGNLGGGVTQMVMGSIVFPLLKQAYMLADRGNDWSSDMAWRTACILPATLCLLMSFAVIKCSDDSPKGNYMKRSRQGDKEAVSTMVGFQAAICNRNTWILFVQYGCCFGVEITMINACALYFHDQFGLSTESAAAIASIFGWMNLFARGVGGFLSDFSNSKYGIRGRLWVQVIVFLLEGGFVILFGQTNSLPMAICAMIITSIFVQAAEGSTFGIVPIVNSSFTGSVAGLVGAGGNFGGVAFSMIFREFNYSMGFKMMGAITLLSSFLSFGIMTRGDATTNENDTLILSGMEDNENPKRIAPVLASPSEPSNP